MEDGSAPASKKTTKTIGMGTHGHDEHHVRPSGRNRPVNEWSTLRAPSRPAPVAPQFTFLQPGRACAAFALALFSMSNANLDPRGSLYGRTTQMKIGDSNLQAVARGPRGYQLGHVLHKKCKSGVLPKQHPVSGRHREPLEPPKALQRHPGLGVGLVVPALVVAPQPVGGLGVELEV